MSNPLVSVVVPVYKVEKYLDRCIESIVNQTYKALEIILVDDGSPDACPRMCDRWAERDSRITVLHKQNEGAGMARNSGLSIATGDYVTFVDSDDYIDLSTVEKCVAQLLEYGSDVVMYGRSMSFDNGDIKKTPVATDELVFKGNQICESLLPGMFTHKIGIGLSTCNKVYKMSIINDHNISFRSERNVLSEDAVFNLELFRFAQTVSVVPECLYYYYKNSKSFSHTYRENQRELNNAFLSCCLNLCESYSNSETLRNSVRSRYHIYALALMKQIKASDFTQKQKKISLYEIYEDKTFRESIVAETFENKSLPLKIFFLCIKLKLYFICDILLDLAK